MNSTNHFPPKEAPQKNEALSCSCPNSCAQCKCTQLLTLEQLCPKQEGRICELPDNPLLPSLGFRPGKPLQTLTRQQFGGPLVIKLNGRCAAISRSLARQVKLICKVDPPGVKTDA